jgi:hypothetical protein
MRMTSSVDVGAGFVNLAVNCEGGGVDRLVAYNNISILIDKNEI